jgi:hypothetical protein
MKKLIKFIANTKEAGLASIEPKPSIKLVPDWYKNIPPYTNGDKKLRFPMSFNTHNSTIKRCVPFLDALTAGYMVVLDDDIYIEQIDKEPFIRWKSDVDIITWHSLEQFPGFEIPDTYHKMITKWTNDFIIKTPPGYSALFVHPMNRVDLPFFTLSGFVDCDSYEKTVQFPFLLKKGFEGIIPAGTPIAQIIPVKRDSWESKREDFDEDKTYIRARKFARTFADSYKKNWWVKKDYS